MSIDEQNNKPEEQDGEVDTPMEWVDTEFGEALYPKMDESHPSSLSHEDITSLLNAEGFVLGRDVRKVGNFRVYRILGYVDLEIDVTKIPDGIPQLNTAIGLARQLHDEHNAEEFVYGDSSFLALHLGSYEKDYEELGGGSV